MDNMQKASLNLFLCIVTLLLATYGNEIWLRAFVGVLALFFGAYAYRMLAIAKGWE